MKNKGIVIVGVLCAIAAIALVGVVAFFILTGNKKNQLTKDTDIGVAKITNVSIVYENNLSTYRAVVTAKEDVKINYILIKAYDKDNKVKEFTGYVGKDLKKDEKVDIISSIDVDITGYTKIQYMIK